MTLVVSFTVVVFDVWRGEMSLSLESTSCFVYRMSAGAAASYAWSAIRASCSDCPASCRGGIPPNRSASVSTAITTRVSVAHDSPPSPVSAPPASSASTSSSPAAKPANASRSTAPRSSVSTSIPCTKVADSRPPSATSKGTGSSISPKAKAPPIWRPSWPPSKAGKGFGWSVLT